MPSPRSIAAASALPALVLAALGISACGSSSSSTTATQGSAPATAGTPSTSTAAPATSAGCTGVSAAQPRAERLPAPKQRLDPAHTYIVTMRTNCGTFDIQLDVRRAPKTASSFAYLVRRGFYDGLSFHRIAAGFVVQGGDPSGNGTGGAGYTIVEKPPATLRYTPGIVAMAKSPSEPDGASSSQFFIVTGTSVALPPQYALVGQVVRGQAAVNAIGAIPSNPPSDGMPTSPVVISRATLSSR